MTARSLVPEQVRRLRARYVKKREEALLDAAAATVALQAYVTDAAGGIDRFDPQMREAFTRALPSLDFESTVGELAESGVSSAEHIGLMSTWKGTYFEILIRDELNAGNYVGDVYLLPGQQAVLADSSSQPGWDLRITDADGLVVEELQAKATDSIGYVREAITKYPDTPIIATDELAERLPHDLVHGSGIDNESIESAMDSALDSIADSPLENVLEFAGYGLPAVLILATEGRRVLVGRSTFVEALERSKSRMTRSAAAIGVGVLVSLTGAGILSLPATFATRIQLTRMEQVSRAAEHTRQQTGRLETLKPRPE